MVESKSEQNSLSAVKAYTWNNLVSDLINQREGLKTGYNSLDSYIRIPQGAITVIAGRPGHGKTSFQLNLLRNMLQDDSLRDRRFYFFSYEETSKYLATKFIMIMAGEVLRDNGNIAAYLGYLPKVQAENSKSAKKAINAAVEKFQEYTSGDCKRLYLVDRTLSGQKLANILGELGKDTGAVFVDYIQKIPVEGSNPKMMRYQDIKQVSELLLGKAQEKDLPIIVGAQMGRGRFSQKKGRSPIRLENLRESADIEQDASIVLGISRESLDKDVVSEEWKPEELTVRILKNRNGPVGQKVTLAFDGRILRINNGRKF
jgi:replicative DNA helicase